MLWTIKRLQTDGGRSIIRSVIKTENRTIIDHYLVIRYPTLASPFLCSTSWAKNWNAQLSFDTAPEISQSASVYAVRIRSYAPNWKCLLDIFNINGHRQRRPTPTRIPIIRGVVLKICDKTLIWFHFFPSFYSVPDISSEILNTRSNIVTFFGDLFVIQFLVLHH